MPVLLFFVHVSEHFPRPNPFGGAWPQAILGEERPDRKSAYTMALDLRKLSSWDAGMCVCVLYYTILY